MASPELQQAKRIATEGQSFRIPAAAGVFPPRDVANTFFACGHDDRRDDNQAILEWEPFELTEEQYQALISWWQVEHPGARVDRLGLPGSDFSPWFSAAVRRRERARRTRIGCVGLLVLVAVLGVYLQLTSGFGEDGGGRFALMGLFALGVVAIGSTIEWLTTRRPRERRGLPIDQERQDGEP